MTRGLIVHRVGPGVTVQDLGRPGFLAVGLGRGGAADRLALAEGAALLGQGPLAALEMAGMGGTFEAIEDLRIALTGAPMRASIGGDRVGWQAVHRMAKGVVLEIGGAEAGSYGYLSIGGGLEGPEWLGSRATHLAAGIGGRVDAGDLLSVGPDGATDRVDLGLSVAPRWDGGLVRLVPSLQTDRFPEAELARFEATKFTRDTRGNRMGVRLLPEGDGFRAEGALSVLSEVITPGDVQITGDGTPYVLLAECQTTGGYPRIGSVLPCDLPLVAQARPGTELRFQFVSLDEATDAERKARAHRDGLRGACAPLVRDPWQMRDLLSYQLISGVIAGDEEAMP